MSRDARANVVQRFKALPRAPAPNNDSSLVRTNLERSDVELVQNILAHHVAHRPDGKIFGSTQAKDLQLVEAFVRSHGKGTISEDGGVQLRQFRQMRPDKLEAVTVCELVVGENMLNVHGTFAGACAMHIIDIATFCPLLALSVVTGVDATGFSTSMNLVWHTPAIRGMTLRFVGTTLSFKGRMASARCEVYDKHKGTLLISGTHNIAPIQVPKVVPDAGENPAKSEPLAKL